jgi:ribosomal protein S18 acetylase RimI-like enzyme
MPAYRFCRTDDVGLLVESWNHCHARVTGEPELSEQGFKGLVRELNLWCSSCMVALDGKTPVGVLLSAKREASSLIHSLAVHPDYRGRGHGRHLLDSLSQKLAILGPPVLRAEVPADREDLRAFLGACGYEETRSFHDYEAAPAASGPGPAGRALDEMAVPATVDELAAAGALLPSAGRAWEREVQTLANYRKELTGHAVASEERIEAFVLYRDRASGERRVEGLGRAADERGGAMLRALLTATRATAAGPTVVPRVGESEVNAALLEDAGFTRAGQHVELRARAVPA